MQRQVPLLVGGVVVAVERRSRVRVKPAAKIFIFIGILRAAEDAQTFGRLTLQDTTVETVRNAKHRHRRVFIGFVLLVRVALI